MLYSLRERKAWKHLAFEFLRHRVSSFHILVPAFKENFLKFVLCSFFADIMLINGAVISLRKCEMFTKLILCTSTLRRELNCSRGKRL